MKSRQEVRDFLQPDKLKGMRCPLCPWTTGAKYGCEFCKEDEDTIVDGLRSFFYPKPKPKVSPKPKKKPAPKKRRRSRKKK